MAETIGTSSTKPIRQWPFIQRTRPIFELGKSDRPPVPFKPALYLPSVYMDMELRDMVVIPKGTIVSCTSTVLGVTGALPLGLLVPANGGSAITDTYTVNDQNAGVRDPNGNLALAGGTYSRVANIPVGVAYQDMFQDIHGRYLNYDTQPETLGILCEGAIEIPYFTYADTAAVSKVDAVAKMKAKIGGLAYGNATDNSADLVNSDFLMSEDNGKFVKWQPVNVATPTANEIQQIVGQVLLVDSNFPKDLLQYVQTYPYTEMPGTETGGFPGALSQVGAVKAIRARLKF